MSLSFVSFSFFHHVINTSSIVHSIQQPELRVKFFMLKFNFPTPRSKVNIVEATHEWIYQDNNINNLTNTWNSRVSVLLSILYAFCIHERWEGEITEASNNNWWKNWVGRRKSFSSTEKKNTQVSMQTILRILRSCLVSAVASHHATRWSAVFSCWCCVGVYRFARMRLNFRHRPSAIHHFLSICLRCVVSMFSKVFQVRVQCQLTVCKAISRYHPAAAGTEERRLMVNCIIRKRQSGSIWFDIRFVSVNVKSLRGFTKQDETRFRTERIAKTESNIFSSVNRREFPTNEFRAQSDVKLLQSVPFLSLSRNEQQNINRIL